MHADLLTTQLSTNGRALAYGRPFSATPPDCAMLAGYYGDYGRMLFWAFYLAAFTTTLLFVMATLPASAGNWGWCRPKPLTHGSTCPSREGPLTVILPLTLAGLALLHADIVGLDDSAAPSAGAGVLLSAGWRHYFPPDIAQGLSSPRPQPTSAASLAIVEYAKRTFKRPSGLGVRALLPPAFAVGACLFLEARSPSYKLCHAMRSGDDGEPFVVGSPSPLARYQQAAHSLILRDLDYTSYINHIASRQRLSDAAFLEQRSALCRFAGPAAAVLYREAAAALSRQRGCSLVEASEALRRLRPAAALFIPSGEVYPTYYVVANAYGVLVINRFLLADEAAHVFGLVQRRLRELPLDLSIDDVHSVARDLQYYKAAGAVPSGIEGWGLAVDSRLTLKYLAANGHIPPATVYCTPDAIRLMLVNASANVEVDALTAWANHIGAAAAWGPWLAVSGGGTAVVGLWAYLWWPR